MTARNDRRDLVTAHHEAGHAVAAIVLGVPVRHATIIPDEPDAQGRTLGHVRFRSGDADLPSLGHRLLIVTLAGPAAQRRFAPRSPIRANAVCDFHHARLDSETCSSSPAAARSLHRWAQHEARALVAREWLVVEHVAAALIERRTLSGDEIRDIGARVMAARESVAAEYRKTRLREPMAIAALVDEHETHWRRLRPVRRADVAKAMMAVMGEVLALGVDIEIHKIRAAVIYQLFAAGFHETFAEEKLDAIIAARAPFEGWRPVTENGRALGRPRACGPYQVEGVTE